MDQEKIGVLELIDRRRRGLHDPYRLGLCLEGGGMRGVVSGAMLIALEDLGISEYIDVFYGTSSGSINLAYFAAGARWDALSVYYDHLIDGFIRSRRLRPWAQSVDMEYLFDEVMTNRVPLDITAAANSNMNLRIARTDVDNVTPEVVRMQGRSDVMEVLRGGAWLPILAGPPFVSNGHRYLDGGILWADPFYAAANDIERPTHLLLLNTAPQGRSSEHPKWNRLVLKKILNHWQSGLGTGYFESRSEWDIDTQKIGTGSEVSVRGMQVLRLQPSSKSHDVTRLTVDRGVLLQGARAGYSSICDVFLDSNAPHFFSITRD